MSPLVAGIWCAVGLGLVIWWLTRPVERWVAPWKPCHHCKRVWRQDERGSLDYMVPLVWNYGQGGEMCPLCEAAVMEIEEIESDLSV